jgi:hypothetical protein
MVALRDGMQKGLGCDWGSEWPIFDRLLIVVSWHVNLLSGSDVWGLR